MTQTKTEEEQRYFLEVSKMPAILKYTHIVYNMLLDKSLEETISIPMVEDAITAPVYRGNITEIIDGSGASKTYYSQIRRILMDNECIHMLERGTAHSPSVVVIDPAKRPPMTMAGIVKSDALRLTDVAGDVTVAVQRIEVLEARLGEINVVEAMLNFEKRLLALENQNGSND